MSLIRGIRKLPLLVGTLVTVPLSPEGGVPIAEIIPYAKNQSERLADRIARLIKSGSIVPNGEPLHLEMLVNHPGAVDRFLQYGRR